MLPRSTRKRFDESRTARARTKRAPKGHQKDTSVRNYRLQSGHEPVTAGRGPASGSAGDESCWRQSNEAPQLDAGSAVDGRHT